MNFTPGQQKLLLYWGSIVNSVFQRVSTADLWDNVRTVAKQEGVELTGVRMTDMNALRSIAARQRTAQENLNAARPGSVITAGMIASDLSARSPQAQQLAPKSIVRFQHDITVDGQLQTVWRASTIDGPLPATVDDLRFQVEQDAEAMADDYGVTHIGIGLMQISAV